MSNQPVHVGGVVLCGGKSTRMGVSKATLPFGEETMLQRVVRLLGEVVDPVVVVCAAGQSPPPLDAVGVEVIVTHDQQQDRGPLEGIRAGLAALPPRVDAAYATSCDVPLLKAGFVQMLIQLTDEHEVVVPVEGKFHHPLAAVYRVSVLPRIERLLTENRLRPVFLFEESATRRVEAEQLRAVDPDLDTLANLNRPEDYRAALKKAGL